MSDMEIRWKVRRHEGMWRVWDSFGDVDSDYPDWESAVKWAASPMRRMNYYAHGGF